MGRTIFRHFDESYLAQVRSYRESGPYRKALRKRKVWVEPLFAEAKDRHGMRRFRLRRLEKVNIEPLTVAAGQNLKRLLAFGSRGPGSAAQAAALRPPMTTPPKMARCHRRAKMRPFAGLFATACTVS